MKRLTIVLAFLFLTTCKSRQVSELADADSIATYDGYSLFQSGNRFASQKTAAIEDDAFLGDVQPLLNRRCVSCHACYESPCQLNMQTYRSLRRGFHPVPLFSGKRLNAFQPAQPRFMDEQSLPTWRNQEFLPVIAHHTENPQTSPEQSIFYQLLKAGHDNPLPQGSPELLPLQDLWDDQGRHQCIATTDQFQSQFSRSNPHEVMPIQDYLSPRKYPHGGMPFGLAPLPKTESIDEYQTLTEWLEKGAQGPKEAAERDLEAIGFGKDEVIKKWEDFFNRNTPKAEQTARYIYEHVFNTNISMDEIPGEFYDLVRARNQSGPIEEIITPLPYDAPGVPRVFYRLKKITRAIAQKRHIVWPLNLNKREYYIDLFWQTPWEDESSRPQYGSNNPFAYFASIPATLRAQFMMENSHIIAGGMVQGSVCIGSRATYAIRDHFWVWFLKPEVDPSVQNPTLGLQDWNDLATAPQPWQPNTAAGALFRRSLEALSVIPVNRISSLAQRFASLTGASAWGATDHLTELITKLSKLEGMTPVRIFDIAHHFIRTTGANRSYAESFERELRNTLAKQGRRGLNLEKDLWDGRTVQNGLPYDRYHGERNPNSWITINRHKRSSTVHYGSEGGKPQSIWVLSYSNFERLYYNLVASYQEWQGLPHKLATWRHMSYVRLEAEDLAISFLPHQVRHEVRETFTRGLGVAKQSLFFPLYSSPGGKKPPRIAETSGVSNQDANQAISQLVGKAQGLLSNRFGHDGATWSGQPTTDLHAKLLALETASKDGSRNYARSLPETSYIRLLGEQGELKGIYTILANRAYQAHNVVFLEDRNRDPQFDSISVYRGAVGAYPNAIFDVPESKVDQFIASIERLDGAVRTSENRSPWYIHLGPFATARTDAKFWQIYDELHAWKARPHAGNIPRYQGIVDLNQYEFF